MDETLPSFGRDMDEVFKSILGSDDERFANMLIADAGCDRPTCVCFQAANHWLLSTQSRLCRDAG